MGKRNNSNSLAIDASIAVGGAVSSDNVVSSTATGLVAASAASNLVALAVNTAPSFVVGGIVTTDLGSYEYVSSVTVQTNGKILVAGGSGEAGSMYGALVRYNLDGSLDPGFSGDGKVIFDLGSGYESFCNAVTVQEDGRIIVAGYSWGSGNNAEDFALARYKTDGSLDFSFDGDGKVVTDFGFTEDLGYAVTIQDDGKILVAGGVINFTNNNVEDFALVRYNVNGSLDTSFSGDGKVTTDIGFQDTGNSVTLQADGKILVAGSSDGNFALARYNVNGSLDTSFSSDGKVTTDIGFQDTGNSVTLQADGKILVAGTSNDGFALARYNTSGSLDTSFSGDGKVTTDLGSGFVYARTAVVQVDGKILVAGNGGLVRYNADGSLDSSFSDDGIVTTGGQSVIVQADGKILVPDSSAGDFTLARYNSNGSLDTIFGAANTLNDTPNYTENGAAAILDSTVQIYDAELFAQGNYKGAFITLVRHGGANVQDVFSGNGNLSFNGSNALLSGVAIGTVSNSNGILKITFNANASQDRVNESLSSLAYSNSSDTPPASVKIDWTFSDGNTGAQGTGGALKVLGSTTVNITATNDLPTGTVAITGQAKAGQTLTASNTLADAEGLGAITYTWKTDAYILGTGDTYTLTESNIGDTLTVTASYTDQGGTQESVTSVATPPVFPGNYLPTGKVSIAGRASEGQLLTATNTIADADGLGVITYTWKTGTTVLSTGHTYTVKTADVGDILTVTADYTDNGGTHESLTSVATGVVGIVNIGTDNDNRRGGTVGNDILKGLGGNDALYSSSGDDLLDGGKGNDTMVGGTGNDIYIVDSVGDVVIEAVGGGNDSLWSWISTTLADNVESLALLGTVAINGTGNTLNNGLQGNTASNVLSGLAGNDALNGGLGNDTLTGGAGQDKFLFNSTPAATNIDTITDFSVADDTLQLYHAIFNQLPAGSVLDSAYLKIGAAAADANDFIIYKPTSGGLFYDADGNGAGAAVQIAVLGVNLALTSADFVVV